MTSPRPDFQPTTELLFAAVEPFGPQCGKRWDDYVRSSGLTQVGRIVSLDTSLCRPAIRQLNAEDWLHNVHGDGRIFFFRDLEYLLYRIEPFSPCMVLALLEQPTPQRLAMTRPSGFEFCGFDVFDVSCDISALTNCGGFDRAFRNQELNACGLLGDLRRAYEVQASLKREYAGQDHADCLVWALWSRIGH